MLKQILGRRYTTTNVSQFPAQILRHLAVVNRTTLPVETPIRTIKLPQMDWNQLKQAIHTDVEFVAIDARPTLLLCLATMQKSDAKYAWSTYRHMIFFNGV